MGKGRNCSWGAISPLIHNILLPDVRFLCLNKDQISLRDKRLFEIIDVEITRVGCINTDRLYVQALIFGIRGNLSYRCLRYRKLTVYIERKVNMIFILKQKRMSCNISYWMF